MGETPTVAIESDDEGGPDAEPDQPDVDDAGGTVADATDAIEETSESSESSEPPTDVEEDTVDLTDEDLGGDLFTGVEDGDSGEGDDADADDGDDEDGDLEDIADGLEGNAAAMEESINDGMAQLGVFGLTDDDFDEDGMGKDELRDEFRDTFEAFRVGYFGSKVVEEYVLTPADGDVSPAWGLAGSMLMAAAMIVWMRPDGDEKVEKLRETARNIAGGGA